MLLERQRFFPRKYLDSVNSFGGKLKGLKGVSVSWGPSCFGYSLCATERKKRHPSTRAFSWRHSHKYQTYMCIYIYILLYYIYIFLYYIYILYVYYVYIYIIYIYILCMYVCIYIYILCMYIYIYIMYVCIYIYILCMYIYIYYVCIYIYVECRL